MYKEETGNIEVYFICYKKEEMKLIETYYDEILDSYCWYINCYLAYKYWKSWFRLLRFNKLYRMLLTVSASKYILYIIDNKVYNSEKEYKIYLKELKKIKPKLKSISELV